MCEATLAAYAREAGYADFGVLQLAHAFEGATGVWKRRPDV